MKYSLAKFADESEARAALGDVFGDESRSVAVEAFTTSNEVAEGIWVLFADNGGEEVLMLPPGISSISPTFAGMAPPRSA